MKTDNTIGQKTIVLFDGVCNFCNASVNFIMKHDAKDRFLFASLQSDKGKEIMANTGYQGEWPDSICVVEGDRVFFRSSAALRISRKMSGLWPLSYGFFIIPRPLRDAVYNLIARNRYKWFGKRETCRIPSPEERAKIIG